MTIAGGDGSNALVVDHISKNFAGLAALSDVSLRLERGEILGLIGPNGSGKTTFINVVTGLLPLSGGGVFVDGVDISNLPPHKVARAGLARTFQTIRLFHDLTVLENVEVSAVSMGLSRSAARKIAIAAIDEMGLGAWKANLATGLPYGLERRVEVARALAMSPRYLLLDEPAAGLNEDESDEMLSVLAPIPAAKNLGMLIVEHDMRLIMRLCDRLHVLNYGKTIGEGAPETVRRIPEVVGAYLGAARAGER